MKHIVCIFFITLTMFLTTTFSHKLPSSFYDINIAQVATPVIQVLLAIGLALFVNIKLSNTNKRNELLINLHDEYMKEFSQLHTKAIVYMNNNNNQLEPEILAFLTSVSNKLRIIEEIKFEYNIQNSYTSKNMREDFMEYKKRLTGQSFKQNIDFELLQIKAVKAAKDSISKKIAKEKMSLYSS